MTKILHILGGSGFGGGTKMVLAVCKHLQTRGMEVTLDTSNDQTIQLISGQGIQFHRTESLLRPINPIKDLQAILELAAYCRREHFDVVHTHTSKGGLVGRLAAHLAGVPHILHTVHGFAFHESSSPLTIAIYATLERLVARVTDKIILVNEFHRDWAIQLNIAPPHKLITIPNGIPENPSPANDVVEIAQLRGALGLSDDVVVIGSVGRLADQKGLEFLLHAMPDLIRKFPNLYLLLVGDGELRPYLETLIADLGIYDHVALVGFQENVNLYYEIIDLIVLPSLREGLSISLLEAMRASKPIVTTTIGSNMRVVENDVTAITVPPSNVDELTKGILRLLVDVALRKRLAIAARQHFINYFTEAEMLNKTYDLYRDL